MARHRVSWQVTGIRKDAYANANRIPVEEDKSAAERGRYLHPSAFGKSTSAGIGPQGFGNTARPQAPASGPDPEPRRGPKPIGAPGNDVPGAGG